MGKTGVCVVVVGEASRPSGGRGLGVILSGTL